MGQSCELNPQVVVLKRDILGQVFVLLVKRTDTGVWTLPGGRREHGETTTTAAIREVKEETGYEVRLVRSLGTYNLPHLPVLGKVFVFVGEVIGGQAETNEEVAEIAWFVSDRLPHLLLPYHYSKINDALTGKENVTIDLPYSIISLMRHYWMTPIILFRMLRFYRFLITKNNNK
jgi:ADP-ribose pyrophosphatase YjhB (NUDIX family)